MKAGQITAKLRDAVPVHFFEDGEDRIQYRNIDIPDSLKMLEIMDFGFDTSVEGKITFRLFFEDGVLPADFPPAREKMTRAEKAAAKNAMAKEVAFAEVILEAITAATDGDVVQAEPIKPLEQPAPVEYRFNVTGERRKELVLAVRDFIRVEPIYKGAPSFAYVVWNYLIDKTGTLIGEPNPELLAALAEQGFIPEDNDAA